MKGVSIVICSYNGLSRLKTTLDHILSQKVRDGLSVEIVFVDNRSTDNTFTFVQEYFTKAEHPFELQFLQENQPGKAYALELGYDHAGFEYIITCDDDNWLNENYVQNAFEIMEQYPEIGLLGGRTIAAFEAGTPPEWFSNYASAYVVGAQAKQEGFYNGFHVWGAGMVLRKKIWNHLRVNGFEFTTGKDISKAVGEDTELSKLVKFLGYKFYYSESLVLHHWMPKNRISWRNCLTMFEGFGRTAVYLNFLSQITKSQDNRINYGTIKFKLFCLHTAVMLSTIVKSFGRVLLPNRFYEGEKLAVKYAETKGLMKELLFNDSLRKRIYEMNSFVNKLKSAG